MFFFFQAEDGIRDRNVTGVQTCALPISFGIDSVIELFSAAVLLWRLRIEASGTATSEHVNFVERRAARLIGYSLYALIAYVIQIGRASCRDRVLISVVAVLLEERKEIVG